jgi:hypothetical protein
MKEVQRAGDREMGKGTGNEATKLRCCSKRGARPPRIAKFDCWRRCRHKEAGKGKREKGMQLEQLQKGSNESKETNETGGRRRGGKEGRGEIDELNKRCETTAQNTPLLHA